jgi:hypothetical protein
MMVGNLKQITLVCLMLTLVAGCGKKGDGLANQAGESVGRHLTDFTKGVGKGIDQKMAVAVSLRPEVLSLGLTKTIAKSLGLASSNGISVYFVASQNVSNTLVARALNAEGAEIGRSRKLVVLAKDDAAYVAFEFDKEMDSAMVKR